MFKIIKATSGLAIFSFLLAVFPWLIGIADEYFFKGTLSSRIGDTIVCEIPPFIAGGAVVSGIIALIYIKKRNLKGKWLAIVAIILGVLGFSFLCA